jgi:hypothetical protein
MDLNVIICKMQMVLILCKVFRIKYLKKYYNLKRYCIKFQLLIVSVVLVLGVLGNSKITKAFASN